jgi:hypothetical protein
LGEETHPKVRKFYRRRRERLFPIITSPPDSVDRAENIIEKNKQLLAMLRGEGQK